jgi:hypothetical protein
MFELIRKEVRRGNTVPLELAGEGRFVIRRSEFVPAYVKTYEEGRAAQVRVRRDSPGGVG